MGAGFGRFLDPATADWLERAIAKPRHAGELREAAEILRSAPDAGKLLELAVDVSLVELAKGSRVSREAAMHVLRRLPQDEVRQALKTVAVNGTGDQRKTIRHVLEDLKDRPTTRSGRIKAALPRELDTSSGHISSIDVPAPIRSGRLRSQPGALAKPASEAAGDGVLEIRIEMPEMAGGRSRPAPAKMPRPRPEHRERMISLLTELARAGGSDLLLKAGQPPYQRVDGELTPLDAPAIEDAELLAYIGAITNAAEAEQFLQTGGFDLSLGIGGVARFRINLFTTGKRPALAARLIPTRIPTLAELGVPPIVARAAAQPQGLLLVTGPTGSGKTTTLASILDFINTGRQAHLLTLEDPIEFVHSDRQSIVTQREIGGDLPSVTDGIRFAQRQDVDVMLVGEIRDLDMMKAAMLAAGAGKLVLATLHTSCAAKSVERVISMFPEDEQAQARARLAITLLCVISQTLVRKRIGGRIAAFEAMMNNGPVRKAIRENKPHALYGIIESGRGDGMVTLEQSLASLVASGTVSREEARLRATAPDILDLLQKG